MIVWMCRPLYHLFQKLRHPLHYTMSSSCPGWADTGAGAGLSPQSATGLVTTRSFEHRGKNWAAGEEKPEPTVKTGH